MSLSFLHGGIALLGVAAAAIPILIHLLMKQKPRPVVFPALHLILKKQTSTVRRLRLRHLLLMALRIAIFALLGLALGRPTLRSSMFKFDQSAPASVALIVDTSLSMTLKSQGKTRLEVAKEVGGKIIEKLPDDSDVTIIESGSPAAGVALTGNAAVSRLKSLEPIAMPAPLNESLALAYKTLAKAQRDRREVYVLSDFARNTWDMAGAEQLGQLAELVENGVRVYALNLRVDTFENIALANLALSQQALPANSELEIVAKVRNDGPAADRALELFLDDQPRDSKPARLPSSQTVEIKFTLPNLPVGVHTGKVSMATGDHLSFDDARYFSIDVHQPIRVLVCSDNPEDAVHWTNALDPFRQQQRPRYVIDFVPASKLEETDVSSYAAVNLLHVRSPSANVWLKLSNYLQAGGGLFVSLGDRTDVASYNSDVAQSMLPAKLEKIAKPTEDVVIMVKNFQSPILARAQSRQNEFNAELATLPVLQYWKGTPIPNQAINVLQMSNGDSAALERAMANRRGRVVLLLTAAHYSPTNFWTEWPRGWTYVVFANQLMRYLAGFAETNLNFLPGDNVVIDLPPNHPFTLFGVTDPSGRMERITLEQRDAALTIPGVKMLGSYKVESADGEKKLSRGFSVNEGDAESDLTPINPDDLKKLIGENRLTIARDPDSLEIAVDEARVGREMFPWLMFLLLVFIVGEGYLSNRIYKTKILPGA